MRPSSMYPACEIELYASRRLIFDWLMAARLPTVIVATATTASMGSQASRAGASGPRKRRSRNANDAAFEATERYAVTVVGAPSYASGAHIWKGAAEILNSRPTAVVATARNTSGSQASRAAKAAVTSASRVDPARPYMIEKPYARKPLEKAPRSRYFIAASFERFSPRR